MSQIPGSIPVTGFIGPTDTADTYAVTDPIYGIDGLRNVNGNTERNAISEERRRAGMFVGTGDFKVWMLNAGPWAFDDTDWTLALDLNVGPLGTMGVMKKIPLALNYTNPVNYQYMIYGQLEVEGMFTNDGEVVLLNGVLFLNGGTFVNNGELIITDDSIYLTI